MLPEPLSVAQQLLTPNLNEFNTVVNASFRAYIQARPAEFHCYRKSKHLGQIVLQCPACLVRICPHCNTESHERGSCQERNAEDEGLFEEWKEGHDVKRCPHCGVPIEREAGCNHMTCARCETHICWACFETFPTSQQVYDHMRGIYGNIRLCRTGTCMPSRYVTLVLSDPRSPSLHLSPTFAL